MASEASDVYILSGQKFIKMLKMAKKKFKNSNCNKFISKKNFVVLGKPLSINNLITG